MDIITVVVSALVGGIVDGLRASGKDAVKEGYLALKARIVSRYDNVRIDQLEQDPLSKERQAVVEEDLRRAGAAHDHELVQLAQNLLATVANFDIHTSASRTAGLPPVEDPIEQVERDAGTEAVTYLVDRHLTTLLNVRSQHAVNDLDLLSARIQGFSIIPLAAREQIARFHASIRTIIREVASRIEEKRFQSALASVETMQLSLVDRQRASRLLEADKKVHVSYQALKITVELFRDLNQMIVEKIEGRASSPLSETNLILGNAILVYELTDFVISYIQSFSVDGIREILLLHEDAKRKIAELRENQQALGEKAQGAAIASAVREQILADIQTRERSIELLEAEWRSYVEAVGLLQVEFEKIRGSIPTLELIRENAKIQIDLIETVAMLQILKQNIGTMKATILTLESMKLVSLSPNRVRRLLGIG